jgi:tRNA(Arg) A34 adenosine deaminase TadA
MTALQADWPGTAQGRRSRHDVTAIIYDKRGRVISIGKNSYYKTHPMQVLHAKKSGKPDAVFLHAEIAAITKCKDLDKAHKIFVIRHTKDGKPALAKPCPICESAIRAANIKHIEHT